MSDNDEIRQTARALGAAAGDTLALQIENQKLRAIVTDLAHVNPKHHTAVETLRQRALEVSR